MPDEDYYTSEKFIWDSLTRSAENGMKGLNNAWKRGRHIAPFIITWPANAVKSHTGGLIEGPVVRSLGDPETWRPLTVEAIKLTDAYAVLRVVQRADHVEVLLESHHGTKHWKLDIRRSGDVNVLGPPKQQPDNQEVIGLLYRRDSKTS